MTLLALDHGGKSDFAAGCALQTDGRQHQAVGLWRWKGHFTDPAAELIAKVKPTAVVMDASTHGRRAALRLAQIGVPFFPVTVVGATAHLRQRPTGFISVPKDVIVSTFQTAMSEKRIRVAALLALADVLSEELKNYVRKTRVSGTTFWENEDHFRGHDDLLFSAMLGIWFAESQSSRSILDQWGPL